MFDKQIHVFGDSEMFKKKRSYVKRTIMIKLRRYFYLKKEKGVMN